MFILPALLLLASAGLVRLPGRVIGIVVALAPLIAASAVGISDWYNRPSLEDYRGATSYLLEHERAGDHVIYYPYFIASAFAHYAAQAAESLPTEVEPGTQPPRIWLAVRFGDLPEQVSQPLADAYAPAPGSVFFPGGPEMTLYQAKSSLTSPQKGGFESRAREASRTGVQGQCDGDPNCDAYGVERCSRPSGQLDQVRCQVFLSGTDDRGDWRCTWVDLWSNERPSQRLRVEPVGIRRLAPVVEPVGVRRHARLPSSGLSGPFLMPEEGLEPPTRGL